MQLSLGQHDNETFAVQVVVDMREFNSSLPSVLHQQGMKIVPVTLEVRTFVDSARPKVASSFFSKLRFAVFRAASAGHEDRARHARGAGSSNTATRMRCGSA